MAAPLLTVGLGMAVMRMARLSPKWRMLLTPSSRVKRATLAHRHQFTAAVTHHQGREILGSPSFTAIELQHDGTDLTTVEGVVDVAAAESGADLPQCCAVVEVKSRQLVAIQLQAPTREAGIKAAAHPFKAVCRFGRLDEVLSDTAELLQAQLATAAIQQFKREP